MTQAVLEEPVVETAPEPRPDTTHQRHPPKTTTRPVGITDDTWRKLSSKRQAFVAEYIEDGNSLRAYQAAGYVTEWQGSEKETLQRRAYSVLKGRGVRAALVEHSEQRQSLAQAKADFALDWIVSELDGIRAKAMTKGDLAVAARCVELIGKTRGLFSDRVVLDLPAQREYTEAEQIEGARLARLLLTEGSGEKPAEADVQKGEEAVTL